MAVNKVRLTIAIPYYSKPRLLLDAIKSVFSQKNPSWHLIVYDDNPSNPLDLRLIENYIQDSRFSYSLNSENLGIGQNWNQCVNQCNTEFLTILHSDDMLCSDYVDRMLSALDNNPEVTAAFCEAQIIDEHGMPTFSFPDRVKKFLKPKDRGEFTLKGEDGVTSLLKGNFIMCPTLCYRLDKMKKNPFSLEWEMVLDLEYYIRELVNGGSFLGADFVAYKYRRHMNNQTTTLGMNRFNEEISFYHSTVDVMQSKCWYTAEKVAKNYKIIKLHLLYHFLGDILSLRFLSVIRKYRCLRFS